MSFYKYINLFRVAIVLHLVNGGTIAEAQYSITKLVPAGIQSGDEFGRGAAISGNTAVFGAFKQSCSLGDNCGALYVFRHDGSQWSGAQKLTPVVPQARSYLGDSAGIDGDVIVGGAPNGGYGALYVFRRNGATWEEEAKLEAADDSFGQLGISCSVSGDIAAGGAPLDSEAGTWAGAVYVFRRVGGVWLQEAKLMAADAEPGDQFGISVSVEGDRMIVGSHRDDDACPADPDCDSGSAYVFLYDGANWNREAKLVAGDAAANDGFAFECQISGNRAIVGATGDDPAGSAYVFRRDGTNWVQEDKLTASDGQPGDSFGIVSIYADTALVGAPGDDDACPGDPGCNSGAAYYFRRSGSSWIETAKFAAPDAAGGDLFGWIKAVAIEGLSAAIGASLRDEVGVDSGAAYAFVISGDDCNQNGIPDRLETDSDGDGVIDVCDNCPDTANGTQTDTDGDGAGNACDPCPFDDPDDADGDGVCTTDDNCPVDPNGGQQDIDSDGLGDVCDPCPGDPDNDADGDGVCFPDDQCPNDPDKLDPGACGCFRPETGDSDGDGVADCTDRCPGVDDAVFLPGCENAIPTVSGWGLVVLALLILTLGKIRFRRSEHRHAG